MKTKELVIKPEANKGSVYKVKYEGGGQVPDQLNGLYTSKREAQRAIDNYVLAKPKRVRVKKDEQTDS